MVMLPMTGGTNIPGSEGTRGLYHGDLRIQQPPGPAASYRHGIPTAAAASGRFSRKRTATNCSAWKTIFGTIRKRFFPYAKKDEVDQILQNLRPIPENIRIETGKACKFQKTFRLWGQLINIFPEVLSFLKIESARSVASSLRITVRA